MNAQRARRVYTHERKAITLVEVVVIIAIIVVVLMLLLPATRGAREGARRNQCLCHFKQLAIAIQNYHDTRHTLPMASTAPLVPTNGIQQYGTVGTASPSAETPSNWTAGQQGDGYSWITQCLPFMEESQIYDALTATQEVPVVRYGKLADAAFALSTNQNLQPDATPASPYIWSIKVPGFVCPSFPGDEDVPAFASIPSTAGSKVATGNYVALAATHYRSTPINHLESGLPTAAGANGGQDCGSGPYCGNGGLPFPGIVDGKVQKQGLRFKDLSAGTSRVVLITESREETLTSWYSGLASYVVAAMPTPNGATPQGRQLAPAEFTWSCIDVANCSSALNKGSIKGETSKDYQPTSPHGGGARAWGPSSRHPGVVLHAFADAHTEGINDNIDPDVYLNLVLRDGPKLPPNSDF
jgi:competence protein ComGC